MAHISRRYFMFGTLLTGALPRPSIASLKALGYQSPNEKLNIAGIGAGGQPLSDMRQCQGENIVALADVDWRRGEQGFKTFEKATKYKDFRQKKPTNWRIRFIARAGKSNSNRHPLTVNLGRTINDYDQT